jgi:hypothetical protein
VTQKAQHGRTDRSRRPSPSATWWTRTPLIAPASAIHARQARALQQAAPPGRCAAAAVRRCTATGPTTYPPLAAVISRARPPSLWGTFCRAASRFLLLSHMGAVRDGEPSSQGLLPGCGHLGRKRHPETRTNRGMKRDDCALSAAVSRFLAVISGCPASWEDSWGVCRARGGPEGTQSPRFWREAPFLAVIKRATSSCGIAPG